MHSRRPAGQGPLPRPPGASTALPSMPPRRTHPLVPPPRLPSHCMSALPEVALSAPAAAPGSEREARVKAGRRRRTWGQPAGASGVGCGRGPARRGQDSRTMRQRHGLGPGSQQGRKGGRADEGAGADAPSAPAGAASRAAGRLRLPPPPTAPADNACLKTYARSKVDSRSAAGRGVRASGKLAGGAPTGGRPGDSSCLRGRGKAGGESAGNAR